MVITRNSLENLKKESPKTPEIVAEEEVTKTLPMQEKIEKDEKSAIKNSLEKISLDEIKKIISFPEDSTSEILDALCVFVYGSQSDFDLVQKSNEVIEKRVRKIELKREIVKLQKELDSLEE